MKITVGILSALFIIGLIVGGVCCAKLETIKPGHVGVSVAKCGSNTQGTGVKEAPIPAGYYWRELICEEVLSYPTSIQTLILTKTATEGSPHDDSITVNSSEGLPINVDTSLSFTLDGSKVPKLYIKYRNDLDHIKIIFMRQTIREALQATFAKYTAEQLYSSHAEDPSIQHTIWKIPTRISIGKIVLQRKIFAEVFPNHMAAQPPKGVQHENHHHRRRST